MWYRTSTCESGNRRLDHKSHNALEKYPTMHHFVTEVCTFLLQNGALWDMGLGHSCICATDLLRYNNVLLQFLLIAAHLNPTDSEEWVKLAEMSLDADNVKQAITCYDKGTGNSRPVKLPWIFPGAPLIFTVPMKLPTIGNSNICMRLNASLGASSIDIFFSWWFPW